jgi:hypothetical protein
VSAHRPTRAEVRQVACPACGAAARKPCKGARGLSRVSHHQERVERYRDGMFGPVPPIDAREGST